jgi:hypothetical protein
MEGPVHPLRVTKDTRTRDPRTKDPRTKDTWTKDTWTKDTWTKDPLGITKAATCKIAVAANVSGQGLVVEVSELIARMVPSVVSVASRNSLTRPARVLFSGAAGERYRTRLE